MFVPLNAKQIYQSSQTGNALIFRGKILKTEDLRDQGARSVTFEVKEVLYGNLKVGETKTLLFPHPQIATRPLAMFSVLEPPPQELSPSSEVVLFVSPNIRGHYIPTGGYGQSLFKVDYLNGKAFVINSLKNSNLISKTSPTLAQKALTEMKGSNQAVSWETFKALLLEK